MKFVIDINDDVVMDIVCKSMDLTIECSRKQGDSDSQAVVLAAKIIRDHYSIPGRDYANTKLSQNDQNGEIDEQKQ